MKERHEGKFYEHEQNLNDVRKILWLNERTAFNSQRCVFSVSIEMNGTGSIDAYGLQTETARCETSGIGNIYCSVSEELNALVWGIGGIRYKGTPKHLRKSVSGIGRVVSRN